LRPLAGILLESGTLVLVLSISHAIGPGFARLLYLLVAQLLATYLVHCPAHYAVGTLVGIRFRSIRLGRTTMVRALPPPIRSLGRLLPILTLATEKDSLARVSRQRAKAMYLSGVAASSGSAFIFAVAITMSDPWPTAVLAWVVAVGYLLSDVAFSPKGGDVMKARAASPTLRSSHRLYRDQRSCHTLLLMNSLPSHPEKEGFHQTNGCN
jgi:hypothetical protein